MICACLYASIEVTKGFVPQALVLARFLSLSLIDLVLE